MRLIPTMLTLGCCGCLASCAGNLSRTWNDQPVDPPPVYGPATIARVPAPQRRFEGNGWTDTGTAEWRRYPAGQVPSRTVDPAHGAIGPVPAEAPITASMVVTHKAATPPAAAVTPAAAPMPVPAAPAPVAAPSAPEAGLAVPAPELLVPPPAAPAAVTTEQPAPPTAVPAAAVESPTPGTKTPTPAPQRASTGWPNQEQALAAAAQVVRDAGNQGWPARLKQSLGHTPRVFLGDFTDKSGGQIDTGVFGTTLLEQCAKAGYLEVSPMKAGSDLVIHGILNLDRDLAQVDLRLVNTTGEAVWIYAIELPRKAVRVDPILRGAQP